MSDFRIKGGGIVPYIAGVNEDGQLDVQSITLSEFAYQSAFKGKAYEFHPPRFTLVNDVDMPLLYLKNISESEFFRVEQIRVSTNGGNTTPHDKAIIVRSWRNTETPTTNVTTGQFGAAATPHSLNLASQINPPLDFRFWDGLGTLGMTIGGLAMTSTQKGQQVNCGFFSQGMTQWEYGGSLIISPQTVMMLTAEIEQDGDAGQIVISVLGYFTAKGSSI